MLRKTEFDMVSAILSVRRKKTKGKRASESVDENDLRDVLEALRTAGLIVVPRGAVTAMQKVIQELLAER